jgi:hypothetical protein
MGILEVREECGDLSHLDPFLLQRSRHKPVVAEGDAQQGDPLLLQPENAPL